MNIINNGNVKCIYQYTTFTCPVCGCSFEYANIFADDFMSECDVRFDHIEAKCPCCNTPVRNYFKDTEVYPIVRVIFYDQLKKKQESNLAELNDRMKKTFNESFKSAMNDVIMAREQFERNHKARMVELKEQLEKMNQSDSFDTDQIDQKIKENQKALEDLLK